MMCYSNEAKTKPEEQDCVVQLTSCTQQLYCLSFFSSIELQFPSHPHEEEKKHKPNQNCPFLNPLFTFFTLRNPIPHTYILFIFSLFIHFILSYGRRLKGSRNYLGYLEEKKIRKFPKYLEIWSKKIRETQDAVHLLRPIGHLSERKVRHPTTKV